MTGLPHGPAGSAGDPSPEAPEASLARPSLSAFVIAGNEEANIARCLEALRFCPEIVVLDSESADATAEIARRFTPRVFVEPWRGYAGQKRRALELCRGEWVLSVDADEVVSPVLAREIREAVDGRAPEEGACAGYLLSRRVFYLGRWIRHGGWGDDRVLRLFLRERVRVSDDPVHERFLVEGNLGRLRGPLDHYTYRDLGHHWTKILEFSRLWAEGARRRGRRARSIDLLLRPPARFLRLYLFRLGFLDGWRGLVIAGMAAAYVFLKYARLKEEESR